MSFSDYHWQKTIKQQNSANVMDPKVVKRLALFAMDQTSKNPQELDTEQLGRIMDIARKREQERTSIVDFANAKMPTFRGVDTNKKISQERIKYGSGVIALAPLLFEKNWEIATDREKIKMLELASGIDTNKIHALQAAGGAGIQSLNLLGQLANMYPEVQSSLSNIPKNMPSGMNNPPQTKPQKKGVSDRGQQAERFKKHQEEMLAKHSAQLEQNQKDTQQRRRVTRTKKQKNNKNDTLGTPSFKKVFGFFVGSSGFIGLLWFFV